MKLKNLLIGLSMLGLVSGVANAGNVHIPKSFKAAKRAMYYKVHGNSGETFYLKCKWSKKKVKPNQFIDGCDWISYPKKYRKRAKRTEAEHVIPASWMFKKNGKWRACALKAKKLKTSMRKYCQEHDVDYRNAHNDLVNLMPASGAINAMRSNKPFSGYPRGSKNYKYRIKNIKKGIAVVIDNRVIVPPKDIRGDIARIGMYMQRHYGVQYSRRQEETFWKWDVEDPVSKEEKALCEKIRKVQGRCVFD